MPLTLEEIRRQSQAIEMVQRVLNAWDFKTWNQLLANNVVVTLNLGAIASDADGAFVPAGSKIQVTGRDAAKKALREVYGDLEKKRFDHRAVGSRIRSDSVRRTERDHSIQRVAIASHRRLSPVQRSGKSQEANHRHDRSSTAAPGSTGGGRRLTGSNGRFDGSCV